jgi:DNA-binding CsgD family transcriptional regulator
MPDNITSLRVRNSDTVGSTDSTVSPSRSSAILTLVPVSSRTESSASRDHPSRGGRARPGEHRLSLTRAEREVAEIVSTGASNSDIARGLGISRHTVESHLKHIFVKLQIVSRVQLAIWFVRHNQ